MATKLSRLDRVPAPVRVRPLREATMTQNAVCDAGLQQMLHTRLAHLAQPCPWVTRIKRGNAIDPYIEVEQREAPTEASARMYGWLTCEAAGQYHYWVVARVGGQSKP